MARIFDAMVISFKDGIYFSQQDEGQLLGGIPPPETVTGYHSEPTFSFLRHMATTLTRYAPILKHINVIRQWTGFYDVTPDARPILGPVDGLDGFIQCHGFSGHGFMLAPMAARLLAEYLVDGTASPILDQLSMSRFENMDYEHERSVVG
jgi:sarcosine oxidase subunit beta